MKPRNWIFKGFAILVILAVLNLVVQAEGKNGTELEKKRGRSRSYANILCDPVKLKTKIDGGGGKGNKNSTNKGKGKAFGRRKGSKTDVLKRVLSEWDKMTAADKKTVADAINATTLKDIPTATLVKIPVLCLDRLTLTGITDAQVVEIAKTETSLFTAKDGAELVADKAALLTKALADKTLAPEYKSTLGEAIGSVELKKKIAELDCSYLTAALLDENILKADITEFDTKFSEKKCKWTSKRNIEETIEIRIKQAALTKDNIEDCATFLAPFLNKLKLGECKKLFDKEKLKAAQATFLDKIKGVEFGKRSRCAAHIMKYIAARSWFDETKFKTLGSLLRYYPVSELKTKDCQKYPIYEGLPYGNAFKKASFECAAKDPIAKIPWASLADTTKLKTEVKGYILTVQTAELAKVPVNNQAATICHADVVSLYRDLLPYGGYGQRMLLAKACKLGSYGDVTKFKKADCIDPKKIEELVAIYKRSSFEVETVVKSEKLDADADCVMAFLKNKDLVSLVRKNDISKAVADKLVPEASTMTISKLTAKWIFDAITKTTAIDQWTGDDLGKYAPLVAAGLSTGDYGKLKVSGATTWSKLCSPRVAAMLPESTRKLIVDQILDSLRVENETHPVSVLTDDDVEAYSGCLGDLPQDDIESASKDVQKAFCEVNGAALAKTCLFGNKAKRASNVKMCTAAIKGGAAWTADGIASMGDFACDLPKADVEAMDDAEFTTAVESFGNCRLLSKTTRDAILTKAKGAKVFGTPDTWTSQTITSLGNNFVYLPKADLDKIGDWLTIAVGIRAISEGSSTGYFKSMETCLEKLKGATAVDDLKKAKAVIFSVILEKIRAPTVSIPIGRRRKRAGATTAGENTRPKKQPLYLGSTRGLWWLFVPLMDNKLVKTE
ncbi:uncharacterized protein LOC135487779 [Lineus longissimus]|uniref:uncharacterized protein LOC135487779 n=1 Tax=Lineus longissimus TaxID=88925 RepID=UPI00315D97DC